MAINLNGSTQYGSRADHANLTLPNGDWAIGGWIRIDDLSGSSFQYLWSQGALGTNNSVNIYLRESSEADGNKATFNIRDGSGNSENRSTNTTPGTNSEWQHFVLQRRSNFIEFYFDGVLGVSTSTTIGSIDPTTDLNIGRRQEDATRFFDGAVADFFKVNSSFSSDEIADLARGGRLLVVNSAPSVYWRLRNTTTPSPDDSGNGLDLTLNSSPTQDDPPPVGNAANEIGFSYQQVVTPKTHTGDTNWTDVPAAKVRSAYLTTGRDYLVKINAWVNINNVSGDVGVRLMHGSTAFSESESMIDQSNALNYIQYTWFKRWTAASGEDLKVQLRTLNASHTVSIDQIEIMALDLTDFTENTDYFYDEVTASTVLGTSESSSNNASVTLTPTAPGDDWLFMATAKIDVVTLTGHISRIKRSGEASSTEPQHRQSGTDATNDLIIQTVFRHFTLADQSNTFEQISLLSSSGSSTREYSSIFGINLARFKSHSVVWTEAEVTPGDTPDFVTEAQTLSFTPDARGACWIFSQFVYDTVDATRFLHYRQQIDNNDRPETQTGDLTRLGQAWASTDELPIQIQSVEDLTAAAHTIDVDTDVSSSANPGAIEDRQIIAVRLEFNPSGSGTTTSASSSLTTSASTSASTSLSTSASSSLTTSASTSLTTSASTSATSSLTTSASTSASISSLTTSASTSASISSLTTSVSTSASATPLPEVNIPTETDKRIHFLRLNRAGDSQRNPIITGISFRIHYHKHDVNETLSKMWVTSDGVIISDLTDRCTEFEFEIICDVVAGTDLVSGDPAVLNIINVSTMYQPPVPQESVDSESITINPRPSLSVHVLGGIYVSDVPDNFVLLDGFNAESSAQPAVFRPNV